MARALAVGPVAVLAAATPGVSARPLLMTVTVAAAAATVGIVPLVRHVRDGSIPRPGMALRDWPRTIVVEGMSVCAERWPCD